MTHEEYMASLPKDVAVKAIMMANIKSKHSYTDINGKRVPVGDYISLPQLQRIKIVGIIKTHPPKRVKLIGWATSKGA